MPSSLAIRHAVRLGLAFAALSSAAASAQNATTLEEEVVVTGSRIRGVEAVGSPVIAVDHDQIVEIGTASTGDLLRKIPQIIGLGASETAATAQNGAANVTRGVSVNLRGIGSNATLLLLDGRRFPTAGTQGQFTDASVIPSLALERVEVVADGGSAIYGSDAVTGVVNLIPRKHFDGFESSARYGSADSYYDWSIGQIAGFGWTGGHLMAALEYGQHSNLNGQDRDFYTSNLTRFGGTDLRSTQCVPGIIQIGTTNYAIPQNSTGTGLTPASFTAGTRNLCDNLKRGDILPELKRTSFMFTGEQKIGEWLELFAEGYYSRRTFELQAAQIVSNLTVPSTNAFYVHPTGGTGNITVAYDFANDGGLPNDPGHSESWEMIAGARQSLPGDWQAEEYIAYGKSEDFVDRHQNLNTTPTGINFYLGSSNPAIAFNPFGRGGITNPATVAAVRNGQFIITGNSDLTVFAAQVDGSLFTLPGGALRLAAGAEYREEGLGGELQSGSTAAPTIVPNDISRDMYAVFAEMYVPIVGETNSVPGIHRLNLSIAGRYEDYSDFGDTFNPKVGLNWQFAEGFTARGSWGTSFRAPGLAENDPRSSGYGLYGDSLPCNHLPPATTCTGIGIAGGNTDLKAEEATTWSIGLDIAPEGTGFRTSLTYFDIDYDNQILALRGTAGLLTNPIYAPYRILNPTAAQISALLSNPALPQNTAINAATVTYIQDGRRHNLGGTIANGYDFDVRQRWTFDGNEVSIGAGGTYFTKLTTALAPGAAHVDVLNTIGFPQKFRARGEFGWKRGAISGVAFVNYVNAYDQTGVTPIRKIESFTTLDIHVGLDLNESVSGLSLAIDVQNAMDKDPPFVNLAGGYDPQSASPIGRLMALSIRKSW